MRRRTPVFAPVLRCMASSGALGAYTRVSKLGAGTFASAHLVRHNDSQKLWVMKRIPCKHMRAANAALVEVKVLMSTGQVVCTLPGSSSTDPSENSRAICRRC